MMRGSVLGKLTKKHLDKGLGVKELGAVCHEEALLALKTEQSCSLQGSAEHAGEREVLREAQRP